MSGLSGGRAGGGGEVGEEERTGVTDGGEEEVEERNGDRRGGQLPVHVQREEDHPLVVRVQQHREGTEEAEVGGVEGVRPLPGGALASARHFSTMGCTSTR